MVICHKCNDKLQNMTYFSNLGLIFIDPEIKQVFSFDGMQTLPIYTTTKYFVVVSKKHYRESINHFDLRKCPSCHSLFATLEASKTVFKKTPLHGHVKGA